MSLDFDKLVIDKIDLVTGFSKSTSECLFMLDEIKDGTLENGAEKVFGTGASGVRISALNRNKTAKFSCNNGFIVGGLLSTQIGTDAEVADTATIVTPAFEIIEVGEDATSVATTYEATGVAGAEIPFIYKANKDNTQGTKYAIAAVASATEFTYAPATKTITLPTGAFVKGDKVIVFYDYLAKGKKYTNKGDSFAQDGRVVIDVLLRDVCDNATVYYAKIVLPSATIDGNFNFSFGNEPTVHAFSCEALQNVCSVNKELWYFIIPENEAV